MTAQTKSASKHAPFNSTLKFPWIANDERVTEKGAYVMYVAGYIQTNVPLRSMKACPEYLLGLNILEKALDEMGYRKSRIWDKGYYAYSFSRKYAAEFSELFLKNQIPENSVVILPEEILEFIRERIQLEELVSAKARIYEFEESLHKEEKVYPRFFKRASAL